MSIPDSAEEEFVFGGGSPPDTPPVRADDLACRVCGRPLTYAGRGRKPTLCAEHKTAAPKAAPVFAKTHRGQEKLAADLRPKLDMLGMLLAKNSLDDGIAVLVMADPLSNDLAASAIRHPKLRKLLENGVKANDDAKLALDVLLLAGMLGMSHGAAMPVLLTKFIEVYLMQATMRYGDHIRVLLADDLPGPSDDDG